MSDRRNVPLPGYDYWDDYPDYPVEDWYYEVNNDGTRKGYWQWVRDCRESDKPARTRREKAGTPALKLSKQRKQPK